MRTFIIRICGGAIALALLAAMPVVAQNAQQNGCNAVAFGRLCQTSTPEPSLVDGRDYGFVELSVAPPDNTEITRANRRSWQALVQRYFAPRARTGQIVAKVYLDDGGQRTLLATVPVALFEIDEKKGVKIVDEGTFSNVPVRVTPYFRLTGSRYLIAYDIEVRSSDQTTSTIVDRVKTAVLVASGVSGTGAVTSAMGAEAAATRLHEIETSLVALANGTGSSTIHGYLAPHNQPSATYHFGFMPNGETTGSVTLRFRRLPSLFTERATADRSPNYGVTTVTDRSKFLTHRVGAQNIEALLQSRLTAPAWAALAAPGTTTDAFRSHCPSLVDEVSNRLDLSQPDATAVLWAALNRGNMTRADIRAIPCVKEHEVAFSALGLPMPSVEVVDKDQGEEGDLSLAAYKPVTAANFSRNELKGFMAGLFTVMNMAPNAPGKASIFERQFADNVRVSESFDIDNDFPTVRQIEDAPTLTRMFIPFSFTLSCYSRAENQSVTFFGRRRDDGPFVRNLWIFTITLGATAEDVTVSNTRVTGLTVREARADDFETAKTTNPDQPDCHSASAVA